MSFRWSGHEAKRGRTRQAEYPTERMVWAQRSLAWVLSPPVRGPAGGSACQTFQGLAGADLML